MKKIVTISYIALVLLSGCKKLDRFPLDSPSSGNFYSNKDELDLAINALYRTDIYPFDSEFWSDNAWQRSGPGNAIIHGTTTIQSSEYSSAWSTAYRGIARANLLLENLNKVAGISDAYRKNAEAQARLVRAYNYGFLVARFGDVPLIKNTQTVEEARKVSRTAKAEIIKFVYDEFDFAALQLPLNYASGNQYYTKGTALAMKARTALSINDWTTAAGVAKSLIDLKYYTLYPSYRDLFLKAGEHSKEVIWSFPRSAIYNVVKNYQYEISRLAGGYAATMPTLELIDSYECTDGKTIDKSGLYDPKNPFVNRDPRLKATIVTPGENWLGYDYQNNPNITSVYSYSLGRMVPNADARSASFPFASFTGYLFKKGIDASILPAFNRTDFDIIILRYAEILLTYAEAKIELNQIDATVLDAINQVRARAYGVNASDVGSYPVVTTIDQTTLRRIVRRERRVEFAFETGPGEIGNTTGPSIRYMDLIRWKLAEKAMNKVIYGVPTNKADYPFAGTPVFDENDIPSYTAFASKLLICDTRKFDVGKHYIWPIPFSEISQNNNLGQNKEWK
jgi:hypothetical protein